MLVGTFLTSVSEFFRLAVYAVIVVQELLVVASHQGGMPITPFVIHAINSATKGSLVHFVVELIVQQLLGKWCNVPSVTSKIFSNLFIGYVQKLILLLK